MVAAHEALRAVDGIDDPAAADVFLAAALLAEEAVLGELAQQRFAQQLFAALVHLGDEIVGGLFANLQPAVMAEHLAGLTRGALRGLRASLKRHKIPSPFRLRVAKPGKKCYNR